MKSCHFFRRLKFCFAALVLLCISVGAFAMPQYTVINGNPLTIHVGEDNSFQVFNADIPGQGQIYPTGSTLADMGWIVQTAMGKFAPDFSARASAVGIGSYTAVTPVTLSTVSGAGTTSDPYTVTVESILGASGLTATMKVTYVDGEEFFRKQWTLQNTGGADQDVSIFLGADIYLASSDYGIPHIVGASDSPGGKDCGAGDYNILLVPQTPVDAYSARSYGTIWSEIGSAVLNNIVGPDSCIDNGAALQWNRHISAGRSVTVSAATSFGPIPTIANFNVQEVTPPQGMRGESIDVVITGVGFQNTTTFDLGTYIAVTNLVILNDNTAMATLVVDSAAPLGWYDVFADQGGGNIQATLNDGFEVVAPSNDNLPVKLIATGSLIAESAFVTEDNQIHVWGFRGSGQAGNGITVLDTTLVNKYPRASRVGDNLSYPYNLRDENGDRLKIKKVHTNAHTLFALTEDGDLWAWGQNHHGSAGCDRIAAEYSPAQGWSATPCMVFHKNHPDPTYRVKIADVDGGEYWEIARSVDGRVFTWGRNLEGQIGDGRTIKVNDFAGFDNRNRQKPVEITYQFEGETVHLTGGAYEHGYAVTSDNQGNYTLWGWGDNEGCGALITENRPNGTEQPCLYGVMYRYSKPVRTKMASDLAKKIVYIGGGNGWGAALLNDGRVIGWGVVSALGQGYTYNGAQVKYPIEINVPYSDTSNSDPVATLFCRYLGCVAVTKSGKVYTWGNTGGSAYPVYGAWPTPRAVNGTVKAIGGSKESITYVNTDNQVFHIGYNNIWRGSMCYEFVRSYNYETERWEFKDSSNWPGRELPVSTGAPWLELDTGFCANGGLQASGYTGVTRRMYREWSNFDEPSPRATTYPQFVKAWHTYCTWPAVTKRWAAPTSDNPWANLPAYCKGKGETGVAGVSYHAADGPTWAALNPKPQEAVQ